MGLKDWLFGRPKNRNTEAMATLKAQLNRKQLEAKNFLRQSEEQKTVARRLSDSKNKVGARQALMRSRLYMQKYNQVQNQVMNLQSTVEAIMNAESTVQTVEAMDVGSDAIDTALSRVSEVDTERVMDKLETQQERISFMNEALSDTSLMEMDLMDEGDLSVEEELAQWEAEAAVGSSSGLPSVPTSLDTTSPSTESKEKPTEDVSDLEAELEALKKQAEGN